MTQGMKKDYWYYYLNSTVLLTYYDSGITNAEKKPYSLPCEKPYSIVWGRSAGATLECHFLAQPGTMTGFLITFCTHDLLINRSYCTHSSHKV